MEENKMPEIGILKSNDRLARAKQYIVGAVFAFVVSVISLGAALGCVVGMKSTEKEMDNIVKQYMETSDYDDRYSEQYQAIKNSEDYYSEVSNLRSYSYTVNMLKTSKNEDLRNKYIEKESVWEQFSKNGLTTAIAAGISVGIAAGMFTASENEKNRTLKEENEEKE